MQNKINLVIVDDQQIFLDSLAMAFDFNDAFNVLAHFNNGHDAIAYMQQHHVDVLVMDIVMPDISGLSIFNEIKQKGLPLKVLGMSGLTNMAAFQSLWQAGINGLIHKSEPLALYEQAIKEVSACHRFLSPELQGKITETPSKLLYHQMSKLEKKLLFCLVEGKTINEIARALNTNTETALIHRQSLLVKLKADTIKQVIQFAIESGLFVEPQYANFDVSTVKPHTLTEREEQVLTYVAKGFNTKEIADLLSLSHYTISDYIKHVYKKLNVSSRAEATREALYLGLS